MDDKLYEALQLDNNSYKIAILPDHDVYKGHFPETPITPGVMTLKMIREIVERNIGRTLHYKNIKNCRFVAVIKPNDTLKLNIITSSENNNVALKATLTDANNADDVRLQLDAELQ